MAPALECPACGHRHRLSVIPAADTFRCEQCGQALKTPPKVASDPGAPPPPARAPRAAATSAVTGAPAPVAPPPRRAAAAAAAATAAVASTTSTSAPTRNVTAVAAPGNGSDADALRADALRAAALRAAALRDGARRRANQSPSRSTRIHWYWRALAWIVAVPLGFVLTAWPAYTFGFIKKDDLLDIFVGTGIGRYVRLGVVTLVWALVTALLVQLFVEGGRARLARRRSGTAAA